MNTARSKEVERLFPELLAQNSGNIKNTCKQLGASRAWYYRKYNNEKDTTFKDKIDEVINTTVEEHLDEAEEQLIKLVRKGNLGAVIFLLKTRGQKRGYIETQNRTHSLPPGVIQFNSIGESPEVHANTISD